MTIWDWLGFSSESDNRHKILIPDASRRNIHKRFILDKKVIGEGSFGIVRKCQERSTQQWYACKSIAKHHPHFSDEDLAKAIRQEVFNLERISDYHKHDPKRRSFFRSKTQQDSDKKTPSCCASSFVHPHILKLIEIFEDKHHVHVVTELCQGGELYDHILQWKQDALENTLSLSEHVTKTKIEYPELTLRDGCDARLQEAKAAVVLRGILQALEYLHDVCHIVHRDLKASNFLFAQPNSLQIKIIDFGLSKYIPPLSEPCLKYTSYKQTQSRNQRQRRTRRRGSGGANRDAHEGEELDNDNQDMTGYLSAMSSRAPSTIDEDHEIVAPDIRLQKTSTLTTSASSTTDIPLPAALIVAAKLSEAPDGVSLSAFTSGDNDNKSDLTPEEEEERRMQPLKPFDGSTMSATSYFTANSECSDSEDEDEWQHQSEADDKISSCAWTRNPWRAPRSYYGTTTSEVGTPFYVAPEVLLDDEYTCLCDIWSIGVIAYLLLSGGHLPFATTDERETVKRIMNHTTIDFQPSDVWSQVTPEAQDFCRQLLTKDPRQRPTAAQALEHPWMRQYGGHAPATEKTS